MKILAPAVLLLINGIWKVSGQGLLEEYAGWTYLDFENNTSNNYYVRENAIIIGIQVSFRNLRHIWTNGINIISIIGPKINTHLFKHENIYI